MKKIKKILTSGLSLVLGASLAAAPVMDRGLMFAVGGADDGIVFYVAPDGSDSGDGSLTSPFATLSAARDAVRKVSGSASGDITVYLRGGDYRLTEPVVFDTRDYRAPRDGTCYVEGIKEGMPHHVMVPAGIIEQAPFS